MLSPAAGSAGGVPSPAAAAGQPSAGVGLVLVDRTLILHRAPRTGMYARDPGYGAVTESGRDDTCALCAPGGQRGFHAFGKLTRSFLRFVSQGTFNTCWSFRNRFTGFPASCAGHAGNRKGDLLFTQLPSDQIDNTY